MDLVLGTVKALNWGFSSLEELNPLECKTIESLKITNSQLSVSIRETSTNKLLETLQQMSEQRLGSLEKVLLLTIEMRKNGQVILEISDDSQFIKLTKAFIDCRQNEASSSPDPLNSILDLLDHVSGIGEAIRNIEEGKQTFSLSSNRVPSSRSRSGFVTSRSDSESGEAVLEKAKTYREKYADRCSKSANYIPRLGSVSEASQALSEMIKSNQIVVLGEASHDQTCMDKLLRTPCLAKSLQERGINHVFVEHLFPEHLTLLRGADRSAEVLNHLTEALGGKQSKALSRLFFLNSCLENGVTVIPADKKSIYQPSGEDINRYNLNERIENLNDHIVSLVKEKILDSSEKALILVGAAHTNHLNASAIRNAGGSLQEDATPGLAEVLPGAREIIIADDGSTTLAVVNEGLLFFIKPEK